MIPDAPNIIEEPLALVELLLADTEQKLCDAVAAGQGDVFYRRILRQRLIDPILSSPQVRCPLYNNRDFRCGHEPRGERRRLRDERQAKLGRTDVESARRQPGAADTATTLTQQEIADKVGMSRTALNKILQGEVDPRLSTVQALADVLEKSIG